MGGFCKTEQYENDKCSEKKFNLRIVFAACFVLITIFFVCFGLSPALQAVSPAPDGAYSGANTAEGGSGTLFSLTSGTNNTALGSQALFSVTTARIRRLALRRSRTIPLMEIQQMVSKHLLETLLAPRMLPSAGGRCLQIRRVSITRPPVGERCL